MTKYILHLLIVTTVVFSSCEQPKSETASAPATLTIQTDSARLEQYFRWAEQIEYINGYDYDLSILSTTEKNRDTVMLLEFLKANYDSVKLFEDFPYSPADLVESVYAIDFNGDDLLDIFYDGPSGGESEITQIFVNKGERYEKVFSGYQNITKADFSDNRLNTFTLINSGCCADPQIVEYYYLVSYSDPTPTFKLEKTIGYLSRIEKPQKQFESPKEFSILSDNAKLRSDCYELDDVEHPEYGSNGNTIASYQSGSKGFALGTKKDAGAEWIYALMSSDSKVDCRDFPTFGEQPTEIRGWIVKTDTDLK